MGPVQDRPVQRIEYTFPDSGVVAVMRAVNTTSLFCVEMHHVKRPQHVSEGDEPLFGQAERLDRQGYFAALQHLRRSVDGKM